MLAMISQPMAGKTNEEINDARSKAVHYLNDLGYIVQNTLYDYSSFSAMHPDLYGLSCALQQMSQCDIVYFCKGWQDARGCRIEHDFAIQYGLEIIYE